MDDSSKFLKPLHAHNPTMSYRNVVHTTTHECPICAFEVLEIPGFPHAFNDIFSTNDPPDDALLVSLRSSLKAIRSLSTEMEKYLTAMQHAKDACALVIKKHEAAIHPIRSLPDDILLHIFSQHVISEAVRLGKEDNNSLRSTRPPWTLSQVSRRWRALTLSSPLLWSSINIRQMESRECPFLGPRWDLFIERSADCDLAVTLHDGHYTFNVSSLTESARLLSRTTRRWRTLDISTRHCVLTPFTTCSFDRLTKLVWNVYCAEELVYSMFQTAPNLRCLKVSRTAKLDLKWDRITDYSCNIDGFPYLPKLTSMSHLTLDLTAYQEPSMKSCVLAAGLSFPSVRTLSMIERMSYGDGKSIHKVSQHLHLPSLTALTIDSEERSLPAFAVPLPHLQSLSIVYTTASADALSVFLTKYDSITSFHTTNVDALKLLRVIPGSPILLPNLTSLSVESDTLTTFPKTTFGVIESRCGGDIHLAPLEELHILGTENAQRQAKSSISRQARLSERWTAILGNIHIVERGENGI